MWGGAKHMGVYEPRLEKPRVSHRTGPSRAGPSRAEPGPSGARPCRASRARPSCPRPSRAGQCCVGEDSVWTVSMGVPCSSRGIRDFSTF